MTTTYEQFVESKVDFQNTYGFDTTDTDLNPILKPHQKDIIRSRDRMYVVAWRTGNRMPHLQPTPPARCPVHGPIKARTPS